MELVMSPGPRQVANAGERGLARLELISLTLAANGLDVAEIAFRLNVGVGEAEALLDGAEHKLDARNRLHAVAIAVRLGLIGIEV
ncbi:MAG: hypothetical protein KDJ87_10595 [Rhizobiaceae bacterium]|nr:hypothetical protein [Rhizobiaceae bacterium]